MKKYYHPECAKCESYDAECRPGCEYNDTPDRCKCFVPRLQELPEEPCWDTRRFGLYTE